MGVSLAASGLGEGCEAFAELAREGGSGRSANVLGFGFRAPLTAAVLANGALAHALDFEDVLDGAPVHPNAAIVPVVLGLAETHDLSGEALVTALAVGCDLVCRLGLAMGGDPAAKGWYPPPILSAFGAAGAAASLLNLSADETLDALGLTLNQATATGAFKASPRSTLRAIRDAFPAQAGLLAAQLALRGVRAFEGPIEGPAGLYQLYCDGEFDQAALLDGLGTRFLGETVSFKLWPSCRGTHAFVEAALALAARRDLPPSAIRSVRMIGGPVQAMLAEPAAQKQAPRTAIDAKFSLPFTVASALVHGRLNLDSFSPQAIADADVLALAARCRFDLDPEATLKDTSSGRLELVLDSGEALVWAVASPLGHPDNPASTEALLGKFHDCAARARVPMAADRRQALADLILDLDRQARPGPAFAELLAGASGGAGAGACETH